MHLLCIKLILFSCTVVLLFSSKYYQVSIATTSQPLVTFPNVFPMSGENFVYFFFLYNLSHKRILQTIYSLLLNAFEICLSGIIWHAFFYDLLFYLIN